MIESKEKLFDATIDLVCEHGIIGASTAKIAHKAGVATGTLFHHFPKKEDLLTFVYIEIQRRKMMSFGDMCKNKSANDEEMGRVFVERITEYWVTHKKQFEFTRQLLNSPFYTKDVIDNVESLHKDTRDMLIRHMEEGKVRKMDIDVLMANFQILMLTMAGLVLSTDDEEKQKQYLKEGYTFIWNAIKP